MSMTCHARPHCVLQDVVTANPETWSFDPFKLTRDGDKLQGRGVTDCLGHVALMTELFRLVRDGGLCVAVTAHRSSPTLNHWLFRLRITQLCAVA